MTPVTAENPWRIVEWVDGYNQAVKKMVCHDSELAAVLNLPFPRGAVAREPVYEYTGTPATGVEYYRRLPWVRVGAQFIDHINQGDRDCVVEAVDDATGDYLYTYQMPGGREFMRRGPRGTPVTRSRLSIKWKRLLGDIQ